MPKTVLSELGYYSTFYLFQVDYLPSTPYAYSLRGEEVIVYAGKQRIGVFYQGKCVAEHPRSRAPSGHTTNTAHMPNVHAKQLNLFDYSSGQY